jgi:NAD(P)H-flavin reductase
LSSLPTSLIPIKTAIIDIKNETQNVRTYYIKLPNGVEIPKPGQFNMIYIHGVGEVPISVSDIDYEARAVAHTVRFVGSVTKAFSILEKNSLVGFRGPYGIGWPMDLAMGKNLILIAGGIGLLPLRPVIREVARNRDKYRKLFILYGAKTPDDLIYRYEYRDYESIPDTELYITIDKSNSDWKGRVGVVTDLISLISIDPSETLVFLCGPEIMMKFAVKELLKKGFKGNKIFLSLERRMKCGVGLCGHCQMGPYFVCRHGPVFPLWFISRYFWVDQI